MIPPGDEIEQVIARMRKAAAYRYDYTIGNATIEEWADELEALLRRSRAVLSPGGAAEKDIRVSRSFLVVTIPLTSKNASLKVFILRGNSLG